MRNAFKAPYKVVKAGPTGNLWAIQDANDVEVDVFDKSEKAKAQAKCDALNSKHNLLTDHTARRNKGATRYGTKENDSASDSTGKALDVGDAVVYIGSKKEHKITKVDEGYVTRFGECITLVAVTFKSFYNLFFIHLSRAFNSCLWCSSSAIISRNFAFTAGSCAPAASCL